MTINFSIKLVLVIILGSALGIILSDITPDINFSNKTKHEIKYK